MIFMIKIKSHEQNSKHRHWNNIRTLIEHRKLDSVYYIIFIFLHKHIHFQHDSNVTSRSLLDKRFFSLFFSLLYTLEKEVSLTWYNMVTFTTKNHSMWRYCKFASNFRKQCILCYFVFYKTTCLISIRFFSMISIHRPCLCHFTHNSL